MERRLMKSNSNKVLWGVCGGIGEYFNIDPTIIRLIWAALILLWGTGLWAYLIAGIIIPVNRDVF